MTTRGAFNYLWRPNNYRRQIRLSVKVNSGLKSTIVTTTGGTVNFHTKVLSIKNYFPNITLQLGSSVLTAIWSQNIILGEKEVFFISGDSFVEVENFISLKVDEITRLLDGALNHFISKFGLLSDALPVWSRHENWFRGEEFIDSIPSEVVVHARGFKKVYGSGVEFVGGVEISPDIGIKRYIENRLREDFRIDYSSVVEWADKNIFSLFDVVRYEVFINNFSVGNKSLFSDWLFERFGGVSNAR